VRALVFSVVGLAAVAFVAAAPTLTAGPRPVTASATPPPEGGPRPLVACGTSKDTVLAKLGMPSQVVGPALWVYREFHTDHQEASQRGYDTLLVVFAENRVVMMRVVNGEQLDAMLARHPRELLAQAEPPRKRS
jgi:hypothetical protein